MKLLRFLQEGEIRPVGENRVEKVDVRVVAATLRDLGKLVEKGEFREDLYYRLNVVNLRVPPLRERARTTCCCSREPSSRRFNRELNREPPVTGFTPEAEALLAAYAWPGNVRELENAIERAVLLAEGNSSRPENLPERIWTPRRRRRGPRPLGRVPRSQADLSLKRAMRALEETLHPRGAAPHQGQPHPRRRAAGDQPPRAALQDQGVRHRRRCRGRAG